MNEPLLTPAFANTASMRPKWSMAASRRPTCESQSDTSQAMASACSAPPRRLTSFVSRAFERAASTTFHPAFTACSAVAAPIPVEAPVMTSMEVLWRRGMTVSFSGWCGAERAAASA
jgi:hypothetical protein